MAERQLRLFAHPKPLLERLGADFFRAAPKRPGVYVMSGHSGQILYIGKSGNLRARLGTYKNAHPDHLSRRTLRLIHSVSSITWEECATERLARVRENELLRLHRPKFNRANVYPKAYCFIGMRLGSCNLNLFRTREPARGSHLYGAFKGAAIGAFGSLLRVVWSILHRPNSPWDLPGQLLGAKPPGQFTFNFSKNSDLLELQRAIMAYLDGKSHQLIEITLQTIALEGLGVFHRKLVESDLESLVQFYETGPARNARLRREHAFSEAFIPQESLDDLIALSK